MTEEELLKKRIWYIEYVLKNTDRLSPGVAMYTFNHWLKLKKKLKLLKEEA